ncbi:MAG: hypothetical protein PHT48_10650 [Dechloromonas sp.]|nr:hypothetical protein [Dechloromonas sp.]
MWLLRLLAGVLVVAIGVLLIAYVLTGRRGFLVLAWRLFRYGLLFALGLFALLFIERLAVIPL